MRESVVLDQLLWASAGLGSVIISLEFESAVIDIISLHVYFSVILFVVLHLHDVLLVQGFCVSLCVHGELAGVNLVEVVHNLVACCFELLFGHSLILGAKHICQNCVLLGERRP